MFMFFLNRPVSIYPYLAGFIAIVIWSFIAWPLSHTRGPFAALIFNMMGFSLWYYLFLIRYYILSGEECTFFNIPLNRFKGIFNIYLVFFAGWIIGANLIMFKFQEAVILALPFVWFGFLFFALFRGILKAKFVSEGLKNNSSIKGMKLDDIYQEFRELVNKKLIESEENY